MIASDQPTGGVHEERVGSARIIKRNWGKEMPGVSTIGVSEDGLRTLADIIQNQLACSSNPREIRRSIMLHEFDHSRR